MRLAIAALFVIAPVAFAQPRTYAVQPGEKSTAQFHAEDTYDSFDGTTNKVSGSIVADTAAPASSSVSIAIDMRALDTGVGLRNREMRVRYLETGKFPEATFKSVSVSGPASIAANTPEEIKVTGDFTLHGVTRRMTIPVRVVVVPDNRIHASASFNVRMPEFGINVPKNVLVTVKEEVPVRLDVWAVAQ